MVSFNKSFDGFSPEVLDAFTAYSWPGNIRELRNVVERSAALCTGNIITLVDLPQGLVSGTAESHTADISMYPSQVELVSSGSSKELIDKYEKRVKEKEHILELMKAYNGNKSRVAQELGITRATLYKKLQY